MNKRAQLTIFIIVSLLLLIFGGLVYYMFARQAATTPVVVPKQIATGEDIVQRVNSYVMDCLRSAISARRTPAEDPLLWQFAAQGSTFKTDRMADIYDGSQTRLAVWCAVNDPKDAGCVNKAPSRESVAEELAALLIEPTYSTLPACLQKIADPSVPVIPGGSIDISAPTLNVTINPTEIIVKLHMNGTARLQSVQKQFSDFIIISPVPLGRLIQIGTDAVNAEARQGRFDEAGYMHDNGFDVVIQKARPYPNIIYNISTQVPGFEKPLALLFGIKGGSTQNRDVRRVENVAGCCIMPDNDCRANIQQATCDAEGGLYKQASDCPVNPGNKCEQVARPVMVGCCQQQDDTCSLVSSVAQCNATFYLGDLACRKTLRECKNLVCSNLAYFYDDVYGAKQNGDSWCTADTITGFGTDFVGNRHYVHSCIGGKEYVEPCRDYREEVCVEGKVDAQSRDMAACKVNRWYDCYAQKTAETCEDVSTRDCFWIPSINIADAGDGANHIAVRHAKMPCVPFYPPGFAFWQASAQVKAACSKINQNNIVNPGPRGQGFNTLHICSRLGDCGNKRSWLGDLTKKGYTNPEGKPKDKHYNAYTFTFQKLQNPIGNTFLNALPHYALLYSFQRQIYGWTHGVSLSDALDNHVDQNINVPTGFKKGGIKCKPWVAPTGTNKCDLCNQDPLRPCTEYRCKSIGACVWNWDKGVGNCAAAGANTLDTIGPTITIDPASFTSSRLTITAAPSSVGGDPAIKVNPPLPGNVPILFRVDTDEASTCVASPAPRGTDIDALEESGFIDERIALSSFDIPIGSGDYLMQHEAGFFTPTGDAMAAIAQYFQEVTFYITCEDQAGNPSQNEYAITIGVSDQQVPDTLGPQISIAQIVDDPDEGGQTLLVAMDEPAQECRYATATQAGDYTSLPVLDGCAPGPFDMVFETWAPPGAKTCTLPLTDPSNVPTAVQCMSMSGVVGNMMSVTPVQ